MSVVEEEGAEDGEKYIGSDEVKSNVVRDLVVAASGRDVNCEVKLEAPEGTSDLPEELWTIA
jgi:hypothetical protein